MLEGIDALNCCFACGQSSGRVRTLIRCAVKNILAKADVIGVDATYLLQVEDSISDHVCKTRQ